MCADVRHLKMAGIKFFWRLRNKMAVVRHTAVTYYQRVDAQIERIARCSVFRSECVKKKLYVVLALGSRLVYIYMCAENLCRRYAYLAVEQWQHVYLCRYARRFYHFLLLAVVYGHAVNDYSVEQSVVDSVYVYGHANLVGQQSRCLTGYILLNSGYLQ